MRNNCNRLVTVNRFAKMKINRNDIGCGCPLSISVVWATLLFAVIVAFLDLISNDLGNNFENDRRKFLIMEESFGNKGKE